MAFMLRSEGNDGGKRPLLPAGRRHMTCFGRCTCWELQFRRVGRCRRAASSLLLKSMWTRHGMGPSERQDDDEQMLCWVLIIWPSVAAFDPGSGWSASSSASLSRVSANFQKQTMAGWTSTMHKSRALSMASVCIKIKDSAHNRHASETWLS